MRAVLAFLALFACVSAVVVSGDAYSVDDLFPLSGVVLKFEGPTTYQAVLAEGNYSVELPPGEYEITAYYYEDSKLRYYFQEKMNIEGEGMNYDLVLFPPNEFEEVVSFIGEEDVVGAPEVAAPQAEPDYGALIVLAFVALVAVIAAMYFFLLKKKPENARPREEKKEVHEELPRKGLDGEEKKLLQVLESSEGMSTQKELREIFKCTETKMSLLVSSLEARGLVKRIRRGRENIVKLSK